MNEVKEFLMKYRGAIIGALIYGVIDYIIPGEQGM